MLVIDVSLNRNLYIDTIFIHRIKTGKNGLNTYRIEKPEGFEDKLIKHKYKDDYKLLLKKVLSIILKNGVY